jgi:hypothetical protein
MNLERLIKLHNDSEETFESMWDGKPVVIAPRESERMIAGLAEHFIKQFPSLDLRIEEIQPEHPDPRTPGNPLEENSRGKAFAALPKKKAVRKG